MARFLLGIALGAVSGFITYGLTADGQLAGLVGVVVMILGWLGIAALLVLDD